MARLTIALNGKPWRHFDLEGGDLTLGSDAKDDVVLAKPGVSPHHAELRFQNGEYMLLDLAGENGVVVDGGRVPQVVLKQDLKAQIGPFELSIDLRDNPPEIAFADAPTLVGTREQLLGPVAVAAAPAATAPQPGAPKAAPSPVAVRLPSSGLVAGLARMPKPILFGGVGFLLLLIIALKAITSSLAPVQPQAETSAAEAPAKAALTNGEIIAAHLKTARERINRGDYAAAINEDLDPIFLIDRTNNEARLLKAEADEKLAKAPAVEIKPAEPEPSQPSAPDQAQTATATSAARPGESRAVALTARQTELAARYDRAMAALRQKDYAGAAAGFRAIAAEEPRYRDVSERLTDLERIQAAAAKSAYDRAVALEEEDELLKAKEEIDLACAMPHAPAVCDTVRKRIAQKVLNAGSEAFRRAQIFDSQGRVPEAIALYDRATRMLAADDANNAIAQQRLTFLKSRR